MSTIARIDESQFARLSPSQQGAAIALELHRSVPARSWRERVDALEHPDARAAADAYLRPMLERARIIASLGGGKREEGVDNTRGAKPKAKARGRR